MDERDYSRQPFSLDELKALFKGRDAREYINPKSPAFKAMELKGKALSEEDALKLMAKEPNLIKRPLIIAGRAMIAGFDRDRLRDALK